VANHGQLAALQSLHARAVANGVTDLVELSAQQASDREPAVRAAAGLWCPSTGIIDVHELVHALVGDIEAAGGSVVYRTTLESAAVSPAGPVHLRCRTDGEEVEISAALLVNAAGLAAVDLLRTLRGYPGALLRKAWYAKGNYFTLAGAKPFRHLVYPMPDEAGLGIHATLDLDGAVRFGPNVEWVEGLDYSVDPRHAAEFYQSIRSYWPGLPDGALQPGYAGIRPKLVGPGAKAADFVIEGPAVHGCAGLVNLLGIESPGLTSCLAIGEHVVALERPVV
jgi:L-2-hydroxyglutarate oxidase LhgO